MKYLKLVIILTPLITLFVKYSVNKNYVSDIHGNNTNGENKYDKIYSISLKNKVIGVCSQKNETYSCKIYLKTGNKKAVHEIKMLRTDDLVVYFSPSLDFKRKISSEYLIYPFLFDNFDNYQKVYYPELDKVIDKNELKIYNLENGYYAVPFKYQKLNKFPDKIYYLNILKFREVKSVKISKKYPVKYVISFKSDFLPPETSRQHCEKDKVGIICSVLNSSLISDDKNTVIRKTNELSRPLLNKFIEKYNLNNYKKNETLLPFLITALHNEIKYRDISKRMSVEEILKLKKGDCTEFSEVSVAVLNKLGIYAKRIYGLIYKAEKGKWLYHSWVEYQKDNKIYAFDPVNRKAFIDLNYLRLGEENKDGIIVIPLDIDYINFENVF